jgi:hypothetical protein
VDVDGDLAGLRHAVEVHARDGEAQELLAFAVGGRLGMPDRGQILGQGRQGSALFAGEHYGLGLLRLTKGLLELGHPCQRLLPAPFQFGRHQPAVGIDGLVAALRQARLVARPLELEFLLAPLGRPLLLDLVEHLQADPHL